MIDVSKSVRVERLMRDVGADLGGSGSGGNTDSEAAARRRKMTIQLREARRSLSEPDAIPSHSSAMVRLFAEINRSATPMLGIIALGVCATALAFIDAGPLTTWITFISCATAIGYLLPIAFLDSSDTGQDSGNLAAQVRPFYRAQRLGLGLPHRYAARKE